MYFVEGPHIEEHAASMAGQAAEKVYLNCPFDEKDECKSLGGRWDNNARKWYIHADQDPKPFLRWLAVLQDNGQTSSAGSRKSKRTYLNCPFDDKDECKGMGGRWDPNLRQWYVPEGMELEPFAKWIVKN